MEELLTITSFMQQIQNGEKDRFESDLVSDLQDKLRSLLTFHSLFDLSGVGLMFVKVPSFKIVDVGLSAAKLIYADKTKILGNSIQNYFKDDILTLLKQAYEDFTTKSIVLHTNVITNLGFTIPVEVSFQLSNFNNNFYFVVLIREVSSIEKVGLNQNMYESIYENVFHNSSEAIIVVDTMAKVVNANQSFLDIVGVDIELIKQIPLKQLSADWLVSDNVVEIIHQVIENKQKTIEWTLKNQQTGQLYDMEFTLSCSKYHDKTILIVSGHDITTRKRQERALKQSEERYKTILETITDYVYTVTINKNGITKTTHNKACIGVTGYDPEDFEANQNLWKETIYSEDFDYVNEKIQRIMRGDNPGPFEHRLLRKDGTIRWVSNTPVLFFNKAQKLVSYEGIVKDITLKKESDLFLAQSVLKFKILFETSNNAILITEDGWITDCNNVASTLFGCDKMEIIGKRISDFCPEYQSDGVLSEVSLYNKTEVASNGIPQFYKWNFISTQQSIIDAEVTMSVIDLIDRHYLQIVINDITEINKQKEQERIQKERLMLELEAKNKELEGIIYIASHDLRSPLVNIQGFCQLLELSIQELFETIHASVMLESEKAEVIKILNTKLLKAIKYINISEQKMDSLIVGMLRLSRMGLMTLTAKTVNMTSQLHLILQTLETQIKNSAANIVVHNLPPCFGDEVPINQVFTNLIDNAIKYRNPDRNLQIAISGSVNNGMVQYRIQDNGRGISETDLQKIWGLFYRCDADKNVAGEGLGLTITKKIIERNGGTISVESTYDVGTCFFVTLPASPDEQM